MAAIASLNVAQILPYGADQRISEGVKAVAPKGVSIALACRALAVSEARYRYSPKLDDENKTISNLLIALTKAKHTKVSTCALCTCAKCRGTAGPSYNFTSHEWAWHIKAVVIRGLRPRRPHEHVVGDRSIDTSLRRKGRNYACRICRFGPSRQRFMKPVESGRVPARSAQTDAFQSPFEQNLDTKLPSPHRSVGSRAILPRILAVGLCWCTGFRRA